MFVAISQFPVSLTPCLVLLACAIILPVTKRTFTCFCLQYFLPLMHLSDDLVWVLKSVCVHFWALSMGMVIGKYSFHRWCAYSSCYLPMYKVALLITVGGSMVHVWWNWVILKQFFDMNDAATIHWLGIILWYMYDTCALILCAYDANNLRSVICRRWGEGDGHETLNIPDNQLLQHIKIHSRVYTEVFSRHR